MIGANDSSMSAAKRFWAVDGVYGNSIDLGLEIIAKKEEALTIRQVEDKLDGK